MSDRFSLEDRIIAALRRITRAIDLHSRLLLQKHGLTSPQLAALRTIRRLQPLSVGVLAREVHLSHATVTGILGRMEARGLITRTRGSSDRRNVVVELTDAGSQLANEAPSLLHERFHRKLAELQEWEQTTILATLQRIAAMMDAEEFEDIPLLGSGVTGTSEEDVTRYGEKAVAVTGQVPLAEETQVTTPLSRPSSPPASRRSNVGGLRRGPAVEPV